MDDKTMTDYDRGYVDGLEAALEQTHHVAPPEFWQAIAHYIWRRNIEHPGRRYGDGMRAAADELFEYAVSQTRAEISRFCVRESKMIEKK